MSDETLTITKIVNQVNITPVENTVVISSVGVQGAKGDTGATGATGAQGSSGVVSVTAPITNTGTSTAANIGIDQTSITITESQVTNLVTDLAAKVPTLRTISTTAPLTGGGDLSANRTLAVSAGSTSAAGVLQLTDSVSSTSTTTAATPNSVKTAYDLANNALLKYAASWQVKYRSTYWYENKNGSTITTATFSQNRVYCYPLFIQESITIDRLGVECTTASASTTWRIGIYNSDSNGLPTTVVLDAGTVDTSTTGLKTITVNQTLAAGLYFIAGVWQGGSASPTMRAYGTSSGNWSPIASTTQQSTSYSNEYHVDGITGSLGTLSSLSISSAGLARTQFRVA